MMRTFTTFHQAFGELARELKEMGVLHHTQTMQDKDISHDPDYDTYALQFYGYRVTQPDALELEPSMPWAEMEWAERRLGIEGAPVNPGNAWKMRSDVWAEFIQTDGKFAYSYGERFNDCDQVLRVVDRLREDPGSRQCRVHMWDIPDVDRLGTLRVPCSIYYAFHQDLSDKSALNMEYHMRSCDFATHFQNDVYLAMKLFEYVAEGAGLRMGHFIHTIENFHVYLKDVKGVF